MAKVIIIIIFVCNADASVPEAYCRLLYSLHKTSKYFKGYVDCNWANCTSDCRSYTGYCFKLADGSKSWASRRQIKIVLSSIEVEDASLTTATAREAIYAHRFMSEACGT